MVATEVRSLAQRSAEAAKEIKSLIQDSLDKVEKGTELVNRSGATLQGIVGSVKRVTDIVGEIAAASGEQSTGVDQVNTAITQMDHVTQSNSAQTETLAAMHRALPPRLQGCCSWSAPSTWRAKRSCAQRPQPSSTSKPSPAHPCCRPGQPRGRPVKEGSRRGSSPPNGRERVAQALLW